MPGRCGGVGEILTLHGLAGKIIQEDDALLCFSEVEQGVCIPHCEDTGGFNAHRFAQVSGKLVPFGHICVLWNVEIMVVQRLKAQGFLPFQKAAGVDEQHWCGQNRLYPKKLLRNVQRGLQRNDCIILLGLQRFVQGWR